VHKAGLTTVAVTDHDNTGAIDESRAAALPLGIEVISGVELSTMVGEQDIHILGYFFDHHDTALQDHLALFREERRRRAERIV
jgi:predicted metal-dependent phosphoesterase TrpH